MPFVKEHVKAIFENASVTEDDEPSYTVAKGLAGYGRWKFNIFDFYKDVDKFCDSEILGEAITSALIPFNKELSNAYIDNIHSKVLLPLLLELRDKKIDTTKIEDFREFLLNRFLIWLDSSEGKQIKDKIINSFQSVFNPKLEEETKKIEEKNNIPSGKFNTPFLLTREILASEPGIEKALNTIVGKIIQVLDNTVPLGLRQIVPDFILQKWMQLEKWMYKNIVSEILYAFNESAMKIDNRRKDLFIETIKEEVRKQLHAKAATVEKYIL